MKNQLRLDPLTGRWVVVSPDRAERPSAFLARSAPVQEDPSRPCPFCPGHEEDTPPALETYGPSGNWLVRVVPNIYPAFEGDAPFVVSHIGPVFTEATAGGIHEVLILSPDHLTDWSGLGDQQVALVMAAIRDRVAEHADRSGLRYTQVIVNAGREAGASLEHPHGQLLGLPFVPREVVDEQAGFSRFAGGCLLCATVEAEEEAGHRIVCGDEHALVVCPYWSAQPFEMLLIPKIHDPHLHRASPSDLAAIGRALRDAVAQLHSLIGDIAYNLVFHSAPYRAHEPYHWHIHVMPKMTSRAGFELGTGMSINIVAPEIAAGELRVKVDTGCRC